MALIESHKRRLADMKRHGTDFGSVKRAANGKGIEILNAMGLSAELLQPRNHTCPKCGRESSFKIKEPNEGGACCHKCKPTGIGDWFDLVGWYFGSDKEAQKQFVADAIGHTGSVSPGSNGQAKPLTKSTVQPVQSIAQPSTKVNGSSSNGQFEKRFAPTHRDSEILVRLLLSSRKLFTHDGLKQADYGYGPVQFHPNCPTVSVVGFPVYDAATLEQCDWVFYSHDGRATLPAGKGTRAKTRMLNGRDGLLLSRRSVQLLREAKPIEGLRVVKVEGLSDYLAMLSTINETDQNLLLFTQAAGANSLKTAKPFAERLRPLQPKAIFCFGDCDLAGQAGLIGGKTKEGSFQFGYANVLANIAATHNMHLPYEIEPSKGKDICDWLIDGNAPLSIFGLTNDLVPAFELNATDGADRERVAVGDVILNYEIDVDEVVEPLPYKTILDTITTKFDGFPKRVGNQLFIPNVRGDGVEFIPKQSQLFAWMREQCKVDWRSGPGLLGKDELLDTLCRNVEAYDEVSNYPHFPSPIPGVYYTCKFPEPAKGNRLDELLSKFEFATPEDFQLAKAATVTMFWNGPPGQRSGFLISSIDGQGQGKTTFVHKVASIAGGLIEFSQNEEIEAIKARLLSDGALSMRVALIDNIKSTRYGNGEFEALVTSPSLSGKKMYVGEARRPNRITIFITMNSPSFSRDTAQRFVNIVLGSPKFSGTWHREVDQFIEAHRAELLAEIAGFFQREPAKLSKLNRWGLWQAEILARLDNPEQVAELIALRESANDADREQADEIESHFRAHLVNRLYWVTNQEPNGGFSKARECLKDPFIVHVPNEVAAQWISESTGDKCSVKQAGSLLDRLAGSKLLMVIKRNPSRTHGRGYTFSSAGATDEETRKHLQVTYLEPDNWK